MSALPGLKELFPEHFEPQDHHALNTLIPRDAPPIFYHPEYPEDALDSTLVKDGYPTSQKKRKNRDDPIHVQAYQDYDQDNVEERRHVCPDCGKRFNRPSSLTTHLNTHTGAKPFQCPFPGCGRQFNVSSNMRRHFRTHPSLELLQMSNRLGGHHYQFVSDQYYRTVPPSPPWTRNSSSPSPSSALSRHRLYTPDTTTPVSEGEGAEEELANEDAMERRGTYDPYNLGQSRCPYGHEVCPDICPTRNANSPTIIQHTPLHNSHRVHPYQLRHTVTMPFQLDGYEVRRAHQFSAPKLKYPIPPYRARRPSASSLSPTDSSSPVVAVQEYPVYSFPPPPPPNWSYPHAFPRETLPS